MRLSTHTIKVPTWTQSAYGEPVPTYGTESNISMMIGWTSSVDQDLNNTLYKQYEYVGLTRAVPEVGALIDDIYIVGHVEEGRWNRVFMRLAEGKERTYIVNESE